jgi:hypothetical protein
VTVHATSWRSTRALRRSCGPATAGAGLPAPEETPALPMPAHDGVGRDEARCLRRPSQKRLASSRSSLSQVRSRACVRVRVGRVSTASRGVGAGARGRGPGLGEPRLEGGRKRQGRRSIPRGFAVTISNHRRLNRPILRLAANPFSIRLLIQLIHLGTSERRVCQSPARTDGVSSADPWSNAGVDPGNAAILLRLAHMASA